MAESLEKKVMLKLPAPAKLNLFLHILGRRADGYHNLQTLFQFLDYSDYLTLKLRSDSNIVLHTNFLNLPNEQNLIVKAAKLIQQHSKTKQGVDIWVEKKLPMGGGLGGGSSNAATTLLGLNQLWQLDYDLATLSQLGLSLGADVPVFIQGKAAFAEGVGEKLTPTKPPEQWYLVTIPNISISTASVFNDPELPRNTPVIDLTNFNFTQGRNDCQQLVEKRYPEIRAMLELLNKIAPSKLTGTGACLFTGFNSEQQAIQAKQRLPQELNSFIAKGCNTSPLHKLLKQSIS